MKQIVRDFEFLNFRNVNRILSHDVWVFGTGETCSEFLKFLDAKGLPILVSGFIDSDPSGKFEFNGLSVPVRTPSHLETEHADLIIASIYFLEIISNVPDSFAGQIYVLSNEFIHAASPLSRLSPFLIEPDNQHKARKKFEGIEWAKGSRDMAELYLELRLGLQDKDFLAGWLELSMSSEIPNKISDLVLGGQSETLIIGGVFDGEQLLELVSTLDSNLNIIGVDLDLSLVPNKRLESFKDFPNLTLIQSALSSRVGTLEFIASSKSSSQVVQSPLEMSTNILHVPATTVDFLLEKSSARSVGVFLDIEGSEYDAILGMTRTLRDKLVGIEFASYHRNQDLFELPILINKMTKKDSEFFFRATNPTFIDSNILVELS